MKKSCCLVAVLSVFLVAFVFSSQTQARTEIAGILTKESTWELNVDVEVGTLKLLGEKGSRTSDGG
ncbi:MAG: hypothetical protein BA861_00865 [Desulfobacterales bacterium S3730MH5]|nr:MAG: hypothetical protein BA861_00865 [Desulfobacterales bacterium S3730MH5]OEU77801.1 MAG: hypothetical protein BA865_12355 [Desulfobacterales bacterium S5133MH4]